MNDPSRRSEDFQSMPSPFLVSLFTSTSAREETDHLFRAPYPPSPQRGKTNRSISNPSSSDYTREKRFVKVKGSTSRFRCTDGYSNVRDGMSQGMQPFLAPCFLPGFFFCAWCFPVFSNSERVIARLGFSKFS